MSNTDEPPREKNQTSSSSLSSPSFSSLPLDILLNILARVPKRYYPILCCVSKNLRSLVRSPDIRKTRSLLGKDYLYICFIDENYRPIYDNWYTLRRIENSTTENLFDSIEFPYPSEPSRFSMNAVGPEIFFIPESCTPSSRFSIFDTRFGELRQGPSLLVKRGYNCVGLVGGKIYMIGGFKDEVAAERFDLKTQTWEAAPIPDEKESHRWICKANVSFNRKVCALRSREGMTCYDTRDGSCQRYEMPNDEWSRVGLCVIDNVLYVYFSRFGLMWYDSELMLWRVVYGLDLDKARSVGIGEYYGKLAFIWEKSSLDVSESKEIWCRMIGLLRSEVGIHGAAESAQLLQVVPHGYKMCHCLSLLG